VYAGCQQAASYFYVNPHRPLPAWFKLTQPSEVIGQYEKVGSPRIFFLKGRCPNISRSCNNYVWDEKHPDRPKPGDDHGGDCVRYLCQARPLAANRNAQERAAFELQHDPLKHLRSDPSSYASAKNMQRLLERAQRRQRGGNVDMSSDGLYQPAELGEDQSFIQEFM
jgi:hypothetical protein